jgi:chemotaxis family two-component system response regulator Rcp1
VKHTILLVDDSKAEVELVRRSLSSGPVAPLLLVAENGAKALQLLRNTPSRENPRPDLILLDLNLPCKNGHEVLAEIKDDPALRQIPVIVLTSSNAERDIADAYDLHANCYVTKPMDIDVFAELLRRIEEFWFSWAKLPTRR